MAQWDRDTKWRQGAFLSAECISALGLSGVSAAEGVVAVVITHDCDLAQSAEIEPNVEILLGHEVPGGAEGNYTYGKNVRRIHAQCTGGTVGCSVELEGLDAKLFRRIRLTAWRALRLSSHAQKT